MIYSLSLYWQSGTLCTEDSGSYLEGQEPVSFVSRVEVGDKQAGNVRFGQTRTISSTDRHRGLRKL